MKFTINALILIFGFHWSIAQSINLQLKFIDKFENPITGVTVVLKNKKNEKVQIANFTDSTGFTTFKVNQNEQFLLSATSIGFKKFEKEISSNEKFYSILLVDDNQTLESITITAKKPLIRQEDDKTIVDPEPLAQTSTTALEILEKTPGLFVDQEGNVYLNSTSPATIYINGREQKMSATDVASILKSLPPNSIEKIEIIRTPSASMDASTSGGSVNIVLKKGVKLGRTGTVNGGFNQGKFGNQFTGISLNRSQDTKSSFINFNVSHRDSYESSEFIRLLKDANYNETKLKTETYSRLPGYSFFTLLGANIDLSKKLEVGYDARLNLNSSRSTTENNSLVFKENATTQKISENLNALKNQTESYSIAQGVFSKYKFDEKGSELKVDLSFNYFGNDGNQNYLTEFTFPIKNLLGGVGDWKNKRSLFAGQADFKYYFPKKFTFESGLKTSVQNFENSTQYFKDGNIKDTFRTNSFTFFENINAAYLQSSKTFGAFILKIGTRLENTVMKGNQIIPRDTTFNINRTDLFPYVFFSRKLFKIANYELRGFLVARRTITRPVYENLNPFPRFVDQYIYESGNPALKPQFTTNYEANISFEDRPIFAFGRNYVKDIFTSVVYQDKSNPLVSYRTYDNLGKNQETYFRILGAIPPGGKYFFVAGTQYSFNQYSGILDNKPFTFERGSWRFFSYHQLKIDDRSTLSLNGFMLVNGQQQFYELGNFGQLGVSINRQYFKKKVMISAQFNDLFFTNNYTFTLNQGNINALGNRKSDTRRFGINFRYSFGQKKRNEGFDLFNTEGLEEK
jgi:iron complex outermembrane receptor protein